MLRLSISDLVWTRGRTVPITGVVYADDGRFLNLTDCSLIMLIQQGEATSFSECSFGGDILVAARACPDPTETYPNDDLYFGDASYTFSALLKPGNYIYLQETGNATIHARRLHFVNTHYVTLFTELPEGIDDTWKWWATSDSPTQAELGAFQFEPSIATMELGPFDIMAQLTDSDSNVRYSVKLHGIVQDPISISS